MPPTPSGARISYRPRREPAASVISPRSGLSGYMRPSYRTLAPGGPGLLNVSVAPLGAPRVSSSGRASWESLSFPLEACVPGPVDLAHPAGAERSDDLVGAEAGAGRE